MPEKQASYTLTQSALRLVMPWIENALSQYGAVTARCLRDCRSRKTGLRHLFTSCAGLLHNMRRRSRAR
jgi:hypothetical protein